MSLILVFGLSALGVFAALFGALQVSNTTFAARWTPFVTGILLGGILIGLAQCIRLLLVINGKF
jgi:hypothetical protein